MGGDTQAAGQWVGRVSRAMAGEVQDRVVAERGEHLVLGSSLQPGGGGELGADAVQLTRGVGEADRVADGQYRACLEAGRRRLAGRQDPGVPGIGQPCLVQRVPAPRDRAGVVGPSRVQRQEPE